MRRIAQPIAARFQILTGTHLATSSAPNGERQSPLAAQTAATRHSYKMAILTRAYAVWFVPTWKGSFTTAFERATNVPKAQIQSYLRELQRAVMNTRIFCAFCYLLNLTQG